MLEPGLKLPPIFCDGMILQRDAVNRIYGEDTLAETVTVIFMGEKYTSNIVNQEFCIELPQVAAGGPYTMNIIGSSMITISDILFGDVYILSGQSNMELSLRRVMDVSGEEISHTCEPCIRQYLIPATYNFREPEKYMYAGSWKKAMNSDLMEFSAAGYFFAKEIHETYQVPIGLIMTAVGGCGIESWMSPAALKEFGDYETIIDKFKDIDYFNKYIKNQQSEADRWTSSLREEELTYSFDENFQDWPTCQVPSLVSDYTLDGFCGSVYLCREVNLDAEPRKEDSMIYMGSIIDSDELWINGQLIGKTDYRYPPRKYQIQKGILKKGINLITLRIVINRYDGGIVKEKPYYLYCDGQKINLEGEWNYRIGKAAKEPMPSVHFPPTSPVCFYNTVVVPLSPIAVKCVLWYQGERNTENPKNYSEKFASMISEWRELFGWEIPFIYVQLANYQEPQKKTLDNGWAEIRDQQMRNLALYNVAMVVTLDIGEGNDLHPQNKKELGVRLAKAAKHLIYHENIVHSGPVPIRAVETGRSIEVQFMYLDNSKTECRYNNFELAGRDGIFHKAMAFRRGNTVGVSSEAVTAPASVRYAWCDNPTEINFYNDAGLPCGGFRIDI